MEQDRYQNFTLLISSIYRNIFRIKDKEMATLGLKGTHVTCLFYIYTYGGGKTATELCKLSGEDKAAISRAIEYLENCGYIQTSEKSYRRPLMLTDKGEKAAKIIADRVNSYVVSASGGLTSDEMKIFYKALSEIENNLRCYAESGENNGN